MTIYDKNYMVVCYMRIVPDNFELMTRDQARAERDHMRYLQPEHMYRVESVDPDDELFLGGDEIDVVP